MTPENKNIEIMSSTVALLLAVTQFSLGTLNMSALKTACNQEIDWDIFNDLIQYHRLESIIHDTLSDSMNDLFPDATAVMLKQRHKTNAAANLLLSAKSIEIFSKFQNKKIPVLSVKGLSVENWLYDKPGIRSSGDIDLLIRTDDLAPAIACMKAMEYELIYLSDRLTSGSRLCKQYIRTQKDLVFIHNTTKITIELHWQLAIPHSAFPLIFDEAWQTRSGFNILGKPIESLPQDMHAVYLCYHGTKHYWQNLFWLYDIAKLMLKDDTDWQAILSQAQHLKAEASLGLALVLASRFFLTPIPDIIYQHKDIIGSGVELSDDIVCKILADTPDWPTSDSITLSSVRQKLNWNSRIQSSKTRILFEWLSFLFSPGINDWESLKLPDYLTPLYRVWRPLRQLFKGLSKLKG